MSFQIIMRKLTRPLDKILRNKFESPIKLENGIDETAAIAALKQLAVSFTVFYGFGKRQYEKIIAHEVAAV